MRKIRGLEKRQVDIGLRPDSWIATRLSLVQNEKRSGGDPFAIGEPDLGGQGQYNGSLPEAEFQPDGRCLIAKYLAPQYRDKRFALEGWLAIHGPELGYPGNPPFVRASRILQEVMNTGDSGVGHPMSPLALTRSTDHLQENSVVGSDPDKPFNRDWTRELEGYP
jgi:hypothetical protein